MRAIAYLISALWLLLASGCDKASEMAIDEENPSGRHTIAYLKAQCGEGQTTLREELTLRATVTANDRLGEYIRAIVIEDESGGISIALAGADLYRRYPIGSRLQIYCNGLTLRNYGGRIELGDTENEYGQITISEELAARHIQNIAPTDRAPEPTVLTIPEITPRHVDCYVRLDNVHFENSGTWCDFDPETEQPITTEHPIFDEAGNRFTVRIIASCHYANEPLPEGKGSLYGIIDYFNGRYALRIVNRGVKF
ncbi:MAG: DUF5689 domain-containing protein [Rikenellaceae bacterium]|nr:DUF5689 domain-containing protein [Rikenellaceae bacterium]